MPRAPWRPTHRIHITHASGRIEETLVMVVMRSSGAHEFWPAATEQEWENNLVPKWGCNWEGRWTWRGLDTPSGQDVAVTIESLGNGDPPGTSQIGPGGDEP